MNFIWELTKGSYQFSEKETKIVLWLLNILLKECQRTCSFLHLLPLDQIKFYWAPGMNSENGVMGSWNFPTPNRIYMTDLNNDILVPTPESNISISGIIKDVATCQKMELFLQPDIIATLIHELNHMFQYRTNKVLFIANRLITLFFDHIPFLEKIGIEYDSRYNAETEELKDFCNDFCACISSYTTAISYKSPDDPENWNYRSWEGIGTYESFYSEKNRQYAKEFIDLINS